MRTNALERSGIRSDTTYTLRDFMGLTGLGAHAMREARGRGLKVKYIGRRGFVNGDDFLEFVKSDAVKDAHLAKAEPPLDRHQ